MQLKVGKSPGINGTQVEVCQQGEEAVLDKLQNLFTNCWEKGAKGIQSSSLCTKQRRQIRPFKLPRHPSPLQCKQNLGPRLAEQAHLNDSTRKHARKLMWVRSNRRRTDMIIVLIQIQKNMRKTEHESICSFRRPEQGI